MSALRHWNVPLTGVPVQLVTALGADADIPLREVWFKLAHDDTDECYIGSVEDGPVSAANHGIHIDAGAAPVDYLVAFRLGPYESGPIKLRGFEVLSASGTLHILATVW